MKRVDKLLASGYIQVEDTSPLLLEDAARLKCEKAISLADCFCIAFFLFHLVLVSPQAR